MDHPKNEDPNLNLYDEEFEEEMDNFWNDEDSSHEFQDDERSEYLHEGSVLEVDDFESEAEEMDKQEVDEGEIKRILEEEEEELIRENGLEDVLRKEDTPEKIILDSLNVEKLINMLSKVRLAWPEDLPSYNEDEYSTDPDRVKFPESFYHCTDKEKTVMWHAENFRRQFRQLFPKRRPLLIAPKNETGTQKLFPTYINPTVLGYPEFLDCMTLANYMKDFLAPEQMDPPTRVPDRTRSHATVFADRKANCFEFAVIIVSLLNGAGYDAYVVDGYASKTICTMDSTEDYIEPPDELDTLKLKANIPSKHTGKRSSKEDDDPKTQSEFMDIFEREDEEKALRPVSPSKYRFKKTTQAFSKHEAEMMKRDSQVSTRSSFHQHDLEHHFLETLHAEAEEDETEEEPAKEHDEGDDLLIKPKSIAKSTPPEKFNKIRTHAWILLLPGKRDVEEAFFIEPFSGTKFDIADENFQGVEAIFNQHNYYVNIQEPTKDPGELSLDLKDPSKWSNLLVEPEGQKKSLAEADSLFQDEEDDTPKKAQMLLEMPASWTPDLEISQEDYERKYPGGKKTFNYNDAIVELAAPYANDDGLVKKVLKFSGKSRNPEDLLYIEEIFEHRKDKLTRRKWVRQGNLLHEYFDYGRRDALKEHIHISGKNNPSYPRDLFYYSNAHPQNVSHRKIVRKGMIETFDERDDLLYFRCISFGGIICNGPKRSTKLEGRLSEPATKSKAKAFLEMLKGDTSGPGSKKRIRRKIAKIIEKYHRNVSKDFFEDIAEKHMLMDEGRLRILFHYGEGNLSRNSLEFFKPRGVNLDSTEFKPEDCVEYQVDRHAAPMDVYQKFKILQRMEADQRVASVLAMQAEDEVYQTVTSRVQEDWHHEIEPDAFAGDRNEEYIRSKEQKVAEDEEDEDDLDDIDFSTPFFEKFGIPKTKQDEILMKKRIMLNSKVKLVKKAHSIRETYERESSHLREKMIWHDRHIEKMTPTQEEDFGHVYKDRLFEMHIMEQRLTRHQELAPKKYYNLLLDVLKHPQLNRYSNKKIPPPKPVVTGPTDEELALAARELAKAKDCCQFYTVKFSDAKKDEDKKKQIQIEVPSASVD